MAVTLTGTNFVAGATVAVSGAGVTVNTVVVGSTYVADRQLRARSGRRSWCPHGDGHDTPAARAAAQTFTINPGLATFAFTAGHPQTFTVPPGVTTLTVTARGAQGGSCATRPMAAWEEA